MNPQVLKLNIKNHIDKIFFFMFGAFYILILSGYALIPVPHTETSHDIRTKTISYSYIYRFDGNTLEDFQNKKVALVGELKLIGSEYYITVEGAEVQLREDQVSEDINNNVNKNIVALGTLMDTNIFLVENIYNIKEIYDQEFLAGKFNEVIPKNYCENCEKEEKTSCLTGATINGHLNKINEKVYFVANLEYKSFEYQITFDIEDPEKILYSKGNMKEGACKNL